MEKKLGINFKLKGETPLDDSVKDIFEDLKNIMCHPSKQLLIRSMTTHYDQDSIDFDISAILWGPYGNEIAHHVWQDVDLLLKFKDVKFDASTIIGWKDSAGEIREGK